LIEEFTSSRQSEDVYRLAALPAPLAGVLLGRGLSIESTRLAIEALHRIDEVTTADEIVIDRFRPRNEYDTPFPKGRFGDGSYGVYYSALDIVTSIEEVAHHQEGTIIALGHPRYFHTVRCSFSGLVLILVSHETAHPELVSQTEDGYPLCQSLGAEAREAGYDALRTSSARHRRGICFPVFSKPTLTKSAVVGHVEMAPDGTGGLRKTQL
jgi:hypothetical protein